MAMSEQLQAARTLLLKAPSQEFHEVLTDIRRLVCNDALLEPICHDTFREFNTREMLQVPREDGKRDVLINSFAEISENEYIDYHSKTVITFDHITQKITSSRPIILKDFDEELEPLRAALSDAVGAYVSSAYPRGAYGVYARKVEGEPEWVICIASSYQHKAHMQTGRWHSVWKVRSGEERMKLSATFSVSIHVYEGGNSLLTSETTREVTVRKKEARAIVKAISKAESTYHNGLAATMQQLSDQSLPAFRRALPLTRSKVNWEKITTMF